MTKPNGEGEPGLRKEPKAGKNLLRDFLRRTSDGSVAREAFFDSYHFLVRTYRRDVELHLVKTGKLSGDDERADRIAKKMGDDATIMNVKANESSQYGAELNTVSDVINKIVAESDESSNSRALERALSGMDLTDNLEDVANELTQPGNPLGFIRLGRALTIIENIAMEELGFDPYDTMPAN